MCAQWRLRSAWASGQSDQSLHCALSGYLRTQAFFMWAVKTLMRLGAHSLCWFCCEAAQLFLSLIINKSECNKTSEGFEKTPNFWLFTYIQMGPVKRIWYLSPMRATKVQASLRIRAVSPEPPLLAHTSRESRGTFRQKARSLAPLSGWACAVKICHAGMLEHTNSLDGAQMKTMFPQIYLQHFRLGALWITTSNDSHLKAPRSIYMTKGLALLTWEQEVTS